MKTRNIRILTLLTVLISCQSVMAQATSSADLIRVYTTEPAFFDYVFTSAVSTSDGDTIFSLNHRNGQTFFLRRGDSLGKYRITSFKHETKRVFNPSINSWQEKQAGKLCLEGPDGQTIILEQGRQLPEPGWIACLVSLESGNWWTVRDKDTFCLEDTTITVNKVLKDSVSIFIGETDKIVPMISEKEKIQIMALRNERKRQIEKNRKLAIERQKAQMAQRTIVEETTHFYRPHHSIETRDPPKFYFGTEFPYPTEFQTLPSIWSPSGKLVQPPTLIPTRFEYRNTGVTIRYR